MTTPVFRPYEPSVTIASDAVCGLYIQSGRIWHCRRARLADPHGTGAREVSNPKLVEGYLTAQEKLRIAHDEIGCCS